MIMIFSVISRPYTGAVWQVPAWDPNPRAGTHPRRLNRCGLNIGTRRAGHTSLSTNHGPNRRASVDKGAPCQTERWDKSIGAPWFLQKKRQCSESPDEVL